MLREGRLSSRALQRMLADQQLSGFIVGTHLHISSNYLILFKVTALLLLLTSWRVNTILLTAY
jgi:hypothetical protein